MKNKKKSKLTWVQLSENGKFHLLKSLSRTLCLKQVKEYEDIANYPEDECICISCKKRAKQLNSKQLN